MASNPNAVWYELAAAQRDAIRGLGLTHSSGTALPSAQVYARKVLVDRQTTLPLVMAITEGRPKFDEDDFEDICLVYPVLVAVVFASNQDHSLSNDLLYWQQSILDLNVEWEDTIRPRVHAAEISRVDIEPDVSVDLAAWQNLNVDVGGLRLWFHTARTRNRPR